MFTWEEKAGRLMKTSLRRGDVGRFLRKSKYISNMTLMTSSFCFVLFPKSPPIAFPSYNSWRRLQFDVLASKNFPFFLSFFMFFFKVSILSVVSFIAHKSDSFTITLWILMPSMIFDSNESWGLYLSIFDSSFKAWSLSPNIAWDVQLINENRAAVQIFLIGRS